MLSQQATATNIARTQNLTLTDTPVSTAPAAGDNRLTVLMAWNCLAGEPWPSEVVDSLAGYRCVTERKGVFAQTLVIRYG